jgi:hypothetical protein
MSGLRVNIAWILLTLGFLFGLSLCGWAFISTHESDIRIASLVIAAGIVALAWFAVSYTINPPKPEPWENRKNR